MKGGGEWVHISKKLKYLIVIYLIVYLMTGLVCFVADVYIWRDTGSFPLSGVDSPSFPIVYFLVLCCFLPLSFQIKNTAKAESSKKIEVVMKCVIIILVTWLLFATIARLTF